MREKIMLPLWLERDLSIIAKGAGRGKKDVERMAIEAYDYSYTPGRDRKNANPYFPPVSKFVEKLSPNLSGKKNSLLGEGNFSEREEINKRNAVKGVVTRLTDLVMEGRFGFQSKNYVIQKGDSDERKKQVYLNRSYRDFVEVLVIAMIDTILNLKAEEIIQVFEKVGVTKELSLKELSSVAKKHSRLAKLADYFRTRLGVAKDKILQGE